MLSFFLRDTLSCRLYFIILSNHNLSSLSQQCENIFLFQLVFFKSLHQQFSAIHVMLTGNMLVLQGHGKLQK